MKRPWYDMAYDREQNRWVVETRGQCYELHCGERVCFAIGAVYGIIKVQRLAA